MSSILILIAIIICWAYTIWHGIKISVQTGKINLEVEIYSMKRFFNKKKTKQN